MHRGWKDILLAVTLGFVLPSILLSLVKKADENIEEKIDLTDINTIEQSVQRQIVLPVLMDDGNVENMKLEDYLVAVLLREMPAEFEIEALKAQAVVARTYTLRRLMHNTKHEKAAVCTDSGCCQGYYSIDTYLEDGGSLESVQKISSAVLDTYDEVLVYDNQLIEATYFSCSGGRTEDAAAVWGSEIPYLVSTESPGEENARHYTDTITLSVNDFFQKIEIPSTHIKAQMIKSVTYTSGGGVERMEICGKEFTGTQLRQLLGLRSTAFSISVIGDTVTITTRGFGHRVGMSQYGADAMAVQGNTYRQILSHYYHNTHLVSFAVIDNAA